MLSIRCNSEEEKIIKSYAASKNISVSEFVRELVLEKIEEEYDLKVVLEYIENKDKINFSTIDEVENELGI